MGVDLAAKKRQPPPVTMKAARATIFCSNQDAKGSRSLKERELLPICDSCLCCYQQKREKIYFLRDFAVLFLNLLVAKMIKAINSMPYPINHQYALCHKSKAADATKENTIQKMTYHQDHISRRLSKHWTTANAAKANATIKNHAIFSPRKTPVRIKFSTKNPIAVRNNILRSLK